MDKKLHSFQQTIENFYKKNRRDLPWRNTTDPYKILVSEIMLQQTQVPRVLIKYQEFIKKFPDFPTLARASQVDILQAWQGLGYNRRGLYLKKIAEKITLEFNGNIPRDPHILQTFPGIGKATAASIIVFSYNIPLAFIETNIRRVFIYFFFEDSKNPMSAEANIRLRGHRPRDEFEQRRIHDNEIFPLIEQTLSKDNPREWFYALMDYGSFLSKHPPAGGENPNKKSKHYTKQSRFEGSVRQVRGLILKTLLTKKILSKKKLQKEVNIFDERFEKAFTQLLSEGFIEEDRFGVHILNN